MSGQRYFKVVDSNGQEGGKYSGSTPQQAASKGFVSMIKKGDIVGNGLTPVNITVRESGRGSSKKVYSYVCERIPLASPMVYTITDPVTGVEREVQYLYRNTIKNAEQRAEESSESSTEEGSEERTDSSAEEGSEEEEVSDKGSDSSAEEGSEESVSYKGSDSSSEEDTSVAVIDAIQTQSSNIQALIDNDSTIDI